MKQITTLCIIQNGDRVLLAMKKRGFGEGWWNGFGGKVKEGETIDEAMIRELEEESSIRAIKYRERAVIDFFFEGTDKEVEMHIYEVTQYSGDPIETEEMAPAWFLKKDIPYNQMWPADKKWMPLFLKGKDFKGEAVFDGNTKQFLRAKFEEK